MTPLGTSALEERIAAGLARLARRALADLPAPTEGPDLSADLQAMRESERA